MGKRIRISALILTLALCLTACMPAGYTNAEKKTVGNEHASEAKEWFSANLPSAKVESAEAYANGIDLFAVITGKYRFEGKSYVYFYDFENGNMYLGYEYAKAVEAAEKRVREMFPGVRYVDLHPAEVSFSTKVLNDKGGEYPNSAEYGAIEKINGQDILPAGADPEEYAEKLLTEGFDGVTYINVYSDGLPDYDRSFFERYRGISSVYFAMPVSFEYDGIYKVSYSLKSANYYHLKLTSIRDGIYGGYIYEIKDSYDENGVLTDHFDDADDYDPSTFYTDTGSDSFRLCIPPGRARPLIFGPKQKYIKTVKIKEDTYNRTPLEEFGRLDSNGKYKYSDDTYTFYYDLILPKTKLRLYSWSGVTSSDDGIYNITIEK